MTWSDYVYVIGLIAWSGLIINLTVGSLIERYFKAKRGEYSGQRTDAEGSSTTCE